MSGPHLGQGMPADLSWITRKLEDQDRQIRELRAANTLDAATVGAGGITLTNNGSLTVTDSNGTVIAIIGALPSTYNRSDGSAQPGIILYREDGSTAAVLGDINATVAPYKQSWQIFDRAGNVIFADDANSGQGIALPYIPFTTPISTSPPTDTTTSSTFVTLQTLSGYKMAPNVTGLLLVQASDASTTGEVQITDGNGVQVGSTITVAAGNFAYVNYGPFAMTGTFRSPIQLNFQARRTAGTGTIGLRSGTPIGVQS